MNNLRPTTIRAALAGLFCFLFLLAADMGHCQSGPPPFPPAPFTALAVYPLDGPPWNGWFGDAAKGFTNLNFVSTSEENGGPSLSMDAAVPAYLNYSVYEDGWTNMVFDLGSFSTWCQGNWSSTTDGGTGPTNWAVLLSVGNWTSNATDSAWILAISPEGTNLVMEAQAGGSNQTVFNVPIDFDAGDWHSVTVTYSSSNCCLYLEGQLVTNVAPISCIPSSNDCSNYGMFVGSLSTNGICQFHGQLQWLDTYDYPLSAEEVASEYATDSSYISYYGGSLPSITIGGSGGFHPDLGPPAPGSGGGGGGGGGGYPLFTNTFTPGTNLCLLIAQTTNPAIVITLSNTIAGSNYLLLAASNLNGPWVTNQSLLATSNLTPAAPIQIHDIPSIFFIAMEAPPPTPGTLKWITSIDASNSSLQTSPALGPDGVIYVTTTSNTLVAMEPVLGEILWTDNIFTSNAADTYSYGSEFTGSPIVGSNGAIYAGSLDGNLYSMGTHGATNWISEVGSFASIYSTPCLGSNGVIYAACDEQLGGPGPPTEVTGVGAFYPDGTTNWFFQPQDLLGGNNAEVDGSVIAGADGTIYFLSEGSRLYAISSDGHLKWFFPVPSDGEPDATPSLAADGSILVGSGNLYFYDVNPDGSLKWAVNFNDYGSVSVSQVWCQPAIGSNGVIYAAAGRNLDAFNPDGTTNWVYVAPDVFHLSSPALATDGTVIIGGDEGTAAVLYAVTNGSLSWSCPFTNAPVIGSPVIQPDGSVIVATGDGNVSCIWGTAPPATNAAWSSFQHDAAHTGRATPTNYSGDCGAPFVFNGIYNTTNFIFSMTGLPGTSNWNVYASTNLANTNWTQVGTNLVLDSTGDAMFTDSNVTGLTQRYYEVSRSNCCSKTIGFLNQTIAPGTNLISDPLYQVDDAILYFDSSSPMNSINELFTVSNAWTDAQSGTEIYKWNGTSFDGDTNGGTREVIWDGSGELTLLPGVGVLMNNTNSTPFTNVFVGLAREQQIFQIRQKTNYLSASIPIAGTITNITGYVPHNGDTIQLWNTNTQTYASYPYISNACASGIPSLGVGQGFVLITTNIYTWTNTWQVCP